MTVSLLMAVLQWVGGLAMALAARRSARRFRGAAVWPLAMARAAALSFILSALFVLATMPALSRVLSHNTGPPAAAASAGWRLDVFLWGSQAGWVLVLLAMAGNVALGVAARRRAARAELARRKERALAHEPRSGTPPR